MSTGQPIRTQADAQRYKNEYIATLRKQIAINDANYKANKLYIETGQLPPSTQMADYRSAEEKLQDVFMLKRDIVEAMDPIAEPAFASNVVDTLMNSPLNIDNKLLRWYAQNVNNFVAKLKERYAYKIAGDADDVQRIVDFINSTYTEIKGNLQSVSDYAKSTTNLTGTRGDVLSVNDIKAVVLNLRDMAKRLSNLGLKQNTVQFNNFINKITELADALPSQDALNELINSFTKGENMGELMTNKIELSDIFKLLEKLPKPNVLFTQMDVLNKAIEGKNERVIADAIDKIKSYFQTFYNNDNMEMIRRWKETWLRQTNQINQRQIKAENRQTLQAIKAERALDELPASKVFVVNPDDRPVNVRQVNALDIARRGIPDSDDEIDGNGLKTKIKKKAKRGRGIANYNDFGTSQINLDKLNDNFVKLRRKGSKANYMDIPTRRVSDKFKNVVNTIVGGGIPKFNDLNGLDEDEKNYLHKLIKKSNLEERLSVPAPSKDQDEKDIHNFEIMKGQIMSGNDSKDLVKRFKLLLLKLSKKNLLPKHQVQELLEDLVMLGF